MAEWVEISDSATNDRDRPKTPGDGEMPRQAMAVSMVLFDVVGALAGGRRTDTETRGTVSIINDMQTLNGTLTLGLVGPIALFCHLHQNPP